VVKKKSRASASRAKGAKKGAAKGAKKSAVKRGKPATRAGITAAQETREGLDVKKLRTDLDRAMDHLRRRIEEGDTNKALSATIDLFGRWGMEIDQTICVPAGGGSCGDDMFIGS
jgi:hypothetical protein